MLKKDITYQDLEGEDVTDTFYFNLTKAELAEMDVEIKGGFAGIMKQLVAMGDNPDGKIIIRLFKDIIGRSVGRRSEDGKRLIKNQDIRDEFLASEAYSNFFMDLIEQPDSGASFFTAIVPKDLVQPDGTIKPVTDVALPEEPADPTPWITEDRDATNAELQRMTPDQIRQAFAHKANRDARDVPQQNVPDSI